jgi:hypothetical protein
LNGLNSILLTNVDFCALGHEEKGVSHDEEEEGWNWVNRAECLGGYGGVDFAWVPYRVAVCMIGSREARLMRLDATPATEL